MRQTTQPQAAQTGRLQQRRRHEQAASRQRRIVAGAAIVILILIGALILARALTANSSPPTAEGPAPEPLVSQLANIPPATFEVVGRGTLATIPIAIRADIARGANGLPLITYVGAEYCPFCAGERWPLIIALDRFGTFSGLRLTHSASDDVYPNTATFSFVGATYTSAFIEFSSVEVQSNVRSGASYQTLQTPTPAQTTLIQKFDAPPYVPASSAGAIPFIDFAGQYIVTGASFDVGVLRGLTQEQIAASLTDANSAQTRAIIGSANALTAAICSATSDAPAEVCGSPAVKSLESDLAAAPAVGQR